MHGIDATVYDISLAEVAWGGTLVAITMAIHAIGMILTVQSTTALKVWALRRVMRAPLIAPLVLAAWLICLVHLVEVGVWAGFLVWKGLLPSAGIAYAFALMTYTTLGSQFAIPLDWRVMQGMLAMAGLMTFAWSTAIVVTTAQDFQSIHVRRSR